MQDELNSLTGMAGADMTGLSQPKEIQDTIDNITPEEKAEALENLQKIRMLVEQMIATGATEDEIEALLASIGISLEELDYAEQLLGISDNETGLQL